MEEFMQIFLAVCGGIITTAGAGTAIYHLYKALTKTDTERDKMIKEHGRELDKCGKRLDNVEDGMAVLMKSNLAIMNHLIDGDHLDELKQATDDLQNYLISQKTDILKS